LTTQVAADKTTSSRTRSRTRAEAAILDVATSTAEIIGSRSGGKPLELLKVGLWFETRRPSGLIADLNPRSVSA
jgi:hypothetical protein